MNVLIWEKFRFLQIIGEDEVVQQAFACCWCLGFTGISRMSRISMDFLPPHQILKIGHQSKKLCVCVCVGCERVKEICGGFTRKV